MSTETECLLTDKAAELGLTFKGVGPDGLRRFQTRDRIRFDEMSLDSSLIEHPVSMAVDLERDEPVENQDEFSALLQVTASSTGVDSHGTEMTEAALSSMARQMGNGVVFIPSHRESEWNNVIGRTVTASVYDSVIAVDGGTGESGKGKALRVVVGLYPGMRLVDELVVRVQGGQRIGTSIGGWFTDMQFLMDDDDEVKRVIIHDVELDHLAVTRRPSNKESWIAGLFQRVERSVRATGNGTSATPPPGELLGENAGKSLSDDESCVRTVSGNDEVSVDMTELEGSTPVVEQSSSTATSDCAPIQAKPLNLLKGSDMGTDEALNPDETKNNLSALSARVESLATSVDKLVGALSSGERKAPTDSVNENEALKSELERVKRELAGTKRQGYRGTGTRQKMDNLELAKGFSHFVRRCSRGLPEDSSLIAVCERQTPNRDKSKFDTPRREELERDLRDLICAAVADGIIRSN